MRVPNYIYIILSFLVLIFLAILGILIIQPITPVAFWEYPYFIIIVLLGTFIVNIVIEYYCFLYYFSKTIELEKRNLFLLVLLVNTITFPATQLAFYFIWAFFIMYVIFCFNIIFEVIVIAIEWQLYRLEFKKFTLPSKKILSVSAGINILSFLAVSLILSVFINLAFPLYRYF